MIYGKLWLVVKPWVKKFLNGSAPPAAAAKAEADATPVALAPLATTVAVASTTPTR